MQILITGATGFVGQALCRSLMAQGHTVIAISRSVERAKQRLGAEIACFKSVYALLDTTPDIVVDAVVNLAGAPIADRRWTPDYKRMLIESRVQATQDVVALCERLDEPPQVVVSGSAMGYYGDQGETVVTESTIAHDDFAHRLCQSWEAATAPLQALGVRCAIIRLGVVLGADGGMFRQMYWPFRCGVGGWIGAGENFMPWILIDDVIRAIEWLLKDETAEGPYNLSGPEPVRQRTFMETVGRRLHRPVKLCMPTSVAFALLGERASMLTTGADMRPGRLVDGGFAFTAPTLEAALTRVLN